MRGCCTAYLLERLLSKYTRPIPYAQLAAVCAYSIATSRNSLDSQQVNDYNVTLNMSTSRIASSTARLKAGEKNGLSCATVLSTVVWVKAVLVAVCGYYYKSWIS